MEREILGKEMMTEQEQLKLKILGLEMANKLLKHMVEETDRKFRVAREVAIEWRENALSEFGPSDGKAPEEIDAEIEKRLS